MGIGSVFFGLGCDRDGCGLFLSIEVSGGDSMGPECGLFGSTLTGVARIQESKRVQP